MKAPPAPALDILARVGIVSGVAYRSRTMSLAGVWTAIATPMRAGAIDWDGLARLLEGQAAGGVAGVIPCGTTGESPTLSAAEKLELISRCCALAKGRFKVCAGTGSNNTAETVEFIAKAAVLPVDAVMVVAPSYNKPPQRGMVAHFGQCAAAAGAKPVMLYNVPGRTAVNVLPETVAEIAKNCPNVVAVKEASGDVIQMSKVLRALDGAGVPAVNGAGTGGKGRAPFELLCGDDGLTLPAAAIGAVGVVSVVSNVAPRLCADLLAAAVKGDLKAARPLHQRVLKLVDVMFMESSPVPVKYALSLMGIGDGSLRAPMCPAEEKTKAAVAAAMKAEGLV